MIQSYNGNKYNDTYHLSLAIQRAENKVRADRLLAEYKLIPFENLAHLYSRLREWESIINNALKAYVNKNLKVNIPIENAPTSKYDFRAQRLKWNCRFYYETALEAQYFGRFKSALDQAETFYTQERYTKEMVENELKLMSPEHVNVLDRVVGFSELAQYDLETKREFLTIYQAVIIRDMPELLAKERARIWDLADRVLYQPLNLSYQKRTEYKVHKRTSWVETYWTKENYRVCEARSWWQKTFGGCDWVTRQRDVQKQRTRYQDHYDKKFELVSTPYTTTYELRFIPDETLSEADISHNQKMDSQGYRRV